MKRHPGEVVCGVGGSRPVYDRYLNYQIGNLLGVDGQCEVPAGPDTCVMISCNPCSGSAIWLCNDQPVSIKPTCAYLATYAQEIRNQCRNKETSMVRGQRFDSDLYSVVVGTGRCPENATDLPYTVA
jgi:hypothetical protein